MTNDEREPEYPYPKDWVWGESGPLSGKWFPKAEENQVRRFIQDHSIPSRASLEAELADLHRQLKWSAFLPQRVMDEVMVFFVLGFFVVMIVSLPVMALVNNLFDTESGTTVVVICSVAWFVVILWRLAQEHQRLLTSRENISAQLRELEDT